MSHGATNWAITQRGLEPATKIVLWNLADRHNKDTGRCDPSQDLLAHDCEMSRASVNRHLDKLEAAGLIRREQRVDPKTRKQRNTQYLLAFDNDFSVSQDETRDEGEPVSQIEAIPCLKSEESRVSNCDTNPVREPIREPCAGGDAAHTPSAFDEFWEAHPRQRDRERCRQLFAEAVAAGVSPSRIIEAAKRYRVEQTGNKVMYLAYAVSWLEHRRWEDYPDSPPPAARSEGVLRLAQFWAGKVRAKKHIAPSAISEEVAACMITNGMVTQRDLLAAGLRL